MKTFKSLISIILISIIISMISNCGVNSPTNSTRVTNNVSNSNIQTPNISPYMSSVHGNVITNEAINLLLLKGDLTPKQKSLLLHYQNMIEQGAIHEDDGLRPFNHFWDSIHVGLGLNDSIGGEPARTWAQNGDLFMYDSAEKDFTNNIGFYDPNNLSIIPPGLDAAMTDLGHSIHIFQDMTSIPHTRNDAHPPDTLGLGIPSMLYGTSGYEDFTYTSYTPPSINNYQIEMVNKNNLWLKFEVLSSLTNHNFFSEDTIPNPKHMPPLHRQYTSPALPNVLVDPQTNNVVGPLGYYPNDISPIVYIRFNRLKHEIQYKLDDVVHKANADILMPRAISYTAGVIKYFLSLKGTGEVIIDNPMDNTTVTSPTVVISGHLTYYAASATVYYHVTGTWSRSTMVVPVTLDTATKKYVFSTVTNSTNNPLTLGTGVNNIEVVADNENVTATNGNLTITYQAGGGGGDDHDDNEEWWDDD